MRVLTREGELRAAVAELRAAAESEEGDARGAAIGLVPTMGALHDGHLALVARAFELARRVVVSIFVNPTQFGPHEDFARYPRPLERDEAMLRKAGCDLLFRPAVETVYPPSHASFVEVGGPAAGLEGACRPGHFRGVATVVCQLLQLVQPDVAVFGEKDAQQLAVVRRMVLDLHLPVAVVGHPTVRAADGLALSSRNAYLDPAERRAAGVLHRALDAAARAIAAGERDGDAVRCLLRATLAAEPLVAVEYAEVVDADTFQPVATLAGRVVLPLAARVGRTRLIDNLKLQVPEA
jgi:pantoate--beta-alanine ligase